MKILIYLLVPILFVFSCGTSEKTSEAEEKIVQAEEKAANAEENPAPESEPCPPPFDLTKDTAIYGIDLEEAVRQTRRYNAYIASEKMAHPVSRGFTIRAAALLEAMELKPTPASMTQNVRGYIGMNEKNEYQLFLLPVRSADIERNEPGMDVILDGFYKNGDLRPGNPTFRGKYVLDFAMPCPNLCPLSGTSPFSP